MLIHTPRLRLLTCQLPHLEAIVREPKSLGPLLGVCIPDGWPVHPEAYACVLAVLRADPLLVYTGWWLYLFLDPERRALVGCGGFRGNPTTQGVVEVGCEIAPAYRGQGLATEAVRALVRYAFTRPCVTAVEAHSLAGRNAQARVLEKAGFRKLARNKELRDGVWCWRITLDAYLGAQCRAG